MSQPTQAREGSTKKPFTVFAFALLGLLATVLVVPAVAAPPAVTCGQTITRSTTLTGDVGPCKGNGIIVGADNITLNLNGYRVLGPNLNHETGELKTATGNFAGVRLPNRKGVTVVGGMPGATISGFDAGIFVNGGSNNRILNLAARKNVGPPDPNALLGDGIVLVNSANNLIQGNIVHGNGRYDGIAVLGNDSNGNTIRSNTVTNTLANPTNPAGNGTGVGIIVSGFWDVATGKLVPGNDVLDNVVRSNDGNGISNVNTRDARVAGNMVEDNGHKQLPGNGIGVQMGLHPESSNGHMVIENNTIRGNGGNGISSLETEENQFLGNLVEHNGFESAPFFEASGGIFVESETGGNLIKGNKVHDNRPFGIELAGTDGSTFGRTDNNRVEGNTVTNSELVGILFWYRGLGTNYIVSNYAVNSGLTEFGDLVDGGTAFFEVPNCGNTVWDDNTYEIATPPCAGNGGHQVSVPDSVTPPAENELPGRGRPESVPPVVRRGPAR